MTNHESKLTLDIIDDLKRERDVWKSRADAHEQNYLAMLKRIDEVVKERDEALEQLDGACEWCVYLAKSLDHVLQQSAFYATPQDVLIEIFLESPDAEQRDLAQSILEIRKLLDEFKGFGA